MQKNIEYIFKHNDIGSYYNKVYDFYRFNLENNGFIRHSTMNDGINIFTQITYNTFSEHGIGINEGIVLTYVI